MKKMTRQERNAQIGVGQRIITSAEWEFDPARKITIEQLHERQAIGNRIILNAMDGIRDGE
jgi:hypothetical protein